VDALYEAWRPRLLHFCTQLLRHAHDAEEVVQDVFARLLQTQNRYRLDGQPEVLLFRLARNRCIDLRRKRRPEPRPDLDARAPEGADRRDLDEAIAQLPGALREALLLTAIDGLGYREAAAILGVSLGTVAARRYAAVAELRRRLR
jgi:RNA polymerase sigma-70 factor (ECF subfamily)